MYFPAIVTFAVLPFVVGAVPASLNSPRIGNLISIPLSRKSNHLNRDGSVDIEKLQAGAHHTMARLDRAFSVYERNTGEPHPLALKRGHSNERRDFRAVSLTGGLNTVTGEIQVGIPAQAFNVHFDTISPDVFLYGPSCSTCNGHKIFDPSASLTADQTDETRDQTFSDSFQGLDTVNGSVFFDNFFVAGFTAIGQAILVASDIGPALQSPKFPADGVVGLGFKDFSKFSTDSFFETFITQNELVDERPVFGLSLAEPGPELVIGGTDTSKFSGELTFVKLDKPNLWQTQLDSISVNGNAISVTTKEVFLDTSNVAISGDSESISNIYANIPGSAQVPNSGGQWIIPCNTDVVVSVTFGGTTFNIPPSAYNLGAVSSHNSTCVGGFSDITAPTWVFGTVFLQNVYIEFDQGNLQVGLAQITVSDGS